MNKPAFDPSKPFEAVADSAPAATRGQFITQLDSKEKSQFDQWVQQNKVPYDPSPGADYDMPGFWKALQAGDPRAKSGVSSYDKRLHFPDTWKTPAHKTFSNESIYATKDAPHWEDNKLIAKDGSVVADESVPQGEEAKPPFDPSKPFEAADDAAPSAAWPSQVDAPPAPSGTLAEKATNVVQRLADATKNTILPTSVDAAKKMLDPRAGRAGVSRLAEEEAARVEGAVKGAKANIDAKLAPFNDALDQAGVSRPHPLLFKALGSDLATDMAAPMLRPSAWQEALGSEGLGLGIAEAPGAAGIKALVKGAATGEAAMSKSMTDAAKAGLALHSENFAVDMGRRALGYTKRFFKKPEDAARANDVAREMLSQMVKDPESGAASKIISPSTDAMLQRAQILSDKAGQRIGQIFDHLDASGVRSVHPDDLVNEVVTQLDPGKTGGRYDRIKAVVQEIKDTINAHETDAGQMTFGEAQQLKNTLRDAAKFNMVSDETSASLYRRAYGIVREAVDKSVGNAEAALGPKGTGILKEYLDSKGIYGKAEEALGAITNKLGTELGTNIMGLRETIVAASELARGNPISAVAAAGSKAVTQKAPALAARVASSLAKYLRTVRPNARPAILKALVNTGTLSVARKYYNEFADRGIHLPKEPKRPEEDLSTP